LAGTLEQLATHKTQLGTSTRYSLTTTRHSAPPGMPNECETASGSGMEIGWMETWRLKLKRMRPELFQFHFTSIGTYDIPSYLGWELNSNGSLNMKKIRE